MRRGVASVGSPYYTRGSSEQHVAVALVSADAQAMHRVLTARADRRSAPWARGVAVDRGQLLLLGRQGRPRLGGDRQLVLVLSATARSRAGRPGGATPRSRSAVIAAAVSSTTTVVIRDHTSRTSGLVARASAPATVTARCARKVA